MKRPFALIGITYLSVQAELFYLKSDIIALILVIVSFLGAVFSLFAFKKRNLRQTALGFCITAAFASVIFSGYNTFIKQPVIDKYSDKEIYVKASIAEMPVKENNMYRYLLETESINGTNEKVKIVDYIEEFIDAKNENQKYEINIDDVMHNKNYGDFGSVTYTEKTRAVIKVQDGCDRFCSYCIIPYARGRVRSRNPENVLKEISEIAKNGIKEVVITGIHVASYGKDFENTYRLIDLLEEINQIDGIERIRLGSIEPLLITEEFVNRLQKLEKICHHFHLSLQSGCTETLKRMNRRYTQEEFNTIVERLRKTYSDVVLTTDIIVGFPDESEEEFEITYNFLNKIKFFKMHIFKYSPRKGTKAEMMKKQISGDVKEIRSKKLLELSDRNENEYLDSYIGKKVRVLFEECDGEFYKGHTANYIMVKVKTNLNLENKLIDVTIKDKEDLVLVAEEM